MSAQDTKFYKKIESIFDPFSPPLVMGILNITNDSFFDGGKYTNDENVLARIKTMIAEGVDIIDVGAQSTRPDADEISQEEEIEKLTNAIKIIRKNFSEILISADTYRSTVAQKAIEAGANIINDVSGGMMDEKMFETISQLKVPYILMHMQGTPKTMQQNPHYDNVTQEIKIFFKEQIEKLNKLGILQIIIDPGFGFGKTSEHNYTLLNELEEFKSLDVPLLVGVSRKSMIWKLLNTSADKALNGTTVVNTIALMKGAKILRVHDVKEAKEAVRIIEKLKD